MAKAQGASEVMAITWAEEYLWGRRSSESSGGGARTVGRGDGRWASGLECLLAWSPPRGCPPLSPSSSVSHAPSYCSGHPCSGVLITCAMSLGLWCVPPVDLGASSWLGMCLPWGRIGVLHLRWSLVSMWVGRASMVRPESGTKM